MAKATVAAAYRNLKSPNIKTKKRALKMIKAEKARKKG
ncbi:putative metal homeostasis protein [Aerococcaceae bacterium DSM 111176]|nr:putative metal homeostasis protein [Aerococcaceae bacterium DSM 111176]MDO5649660.1 putative metal homeostasis protein [Gallicola sp.]